MFHNARVLITGGVGFIGSNLAAALVQKGAQLTLVDNLFSKYGGNLQNIAPFQNKVQFEQIDIRDTEALRPLLQNNDFLFSLAAQTSHMDSMHDPETDLAINTSAQLSILELCRKYNPHIRIVFASTRQLYGRPLYLPVDEKHPTHPVDVNGINKLAGENYHLLYNEVYGIRSSILRLTNTYGPCMRIRDARQTFVGVWIKNILTNTPIPVWGGEQLRDFNYVDDCVEALLCTASAPIAEGKIYNLGSTEVLSLKQLAILLIAAHGSGEYTVHDFPEERKKIDIGDYYSDFSLIQKELNWKPKTTLKQGLAHTVQYFKKHLEAYIP